MLKYAMHAIIYKIHVHISGFCTKRALNTTMIKMKARLWHGIILMTEYTSKMCIKVHEVLFLSTQGCYQKKVMNEAL